MGVITLRMSTAHEVALRRSIALLPLPATTTSKQVQRITEPPPRLHRERKLKRRGGG